MDVAPVARGPIEVTVDDDGKTRIRERYTISAPLAGQLLRISLDPGDPIVAGETILAMIEPMDPSLLDPRARQEAQARVRAATAAHEQALAQATRSRAAHELSTDRLRRVQELRSLGTSTPEDLQVALHQDRMAEADVRSAEMNAQVADFERELAEAALVRTQASGSASQEEQRLPITSPITGKVLRVFRESAGVVSPGEALLELGDPTDLEIEVDVLSSDAVKIVPGQRVWIEHWGGDHVLSGRVRLIEPSAFLKISALGVEEQRVNVILDFVDPWEQRQTLADGFRIEARVVVWSSDDALLVPASAVFRTSAGSAVFRVTEGVIERCLVRLGPSNGLVTVVEEGLHEGESVVVHPSDRVIDGVRAEIRSQSE
ncbi:MAG: hypothetical protein B7Z55_01690 [Planctomycetales bacterium 12-60-4]|nr:MAG: hypothetical protein B7Z55_01690 [Planctomycetales bacterium 12-60-4]